MKITPREIRLHEPEDSDSKDVYINDLVELRHVMCNIKANKALFELKMGWEEVAVFLGNRASEGYIPEVVVENSAYLLIFHKK